MKYKVSIQLDEILKEKKISQYSLIKKTHLSHNFISKLVKHKEIANLDKLATIINALNEEGCNIKPSDLIKFTPLDDTKITVIKYQKINNSFYYFFKIKYQGAEYLDLLKLTLKAQENNTLFIEVEANDIPLYQFNNSMQKAITNQSFYLSKGVMLLVQLPSYEKQAVAQELAQSFIQQVLSSSLITEKPSYIVNISYFSDFGITFNNVDNSHSKITFNKDKNDSIIPFYPEAYQATYPFMHPYSTGLVTKGEHFTKPKPHILTKQEKEKLDKMLAIFKHSK